MVVEKLLAHGAREAQAYASQLLDLTVCSRCGCACPAIDPAVSGRTASPGSPSQILAEARGVPPEGVRFGVILHAREGLLPELEAFPAAGHAPPFTLPDAGEIDY